MAKKRRISAMPFDTEDWLNNPLLRAMRPDVRALWADMLCYMWGSVERGVMVKPNGKPYTREEIKRLVGVDANGSDGWLDEIVMSGLCIIRDDGAYYSRRIVRDEEIRAKRREAGLKGGNVTKGKMLQSASQSAKETPMQTGSNDAGMFGSEETTETPPPPTPEQKAKIEKARKYNYADYVTLTRDEYAKLCEKHTEDGAKRMIEMLNNYKGSKGKRYKSDYLAILNWVVDRYNEEITKNGNQRKTNSTTQDAGRSVADNKGYASGALPTDTTEDGNAGGTASEGYSERF